MGANAKVVEEFTEALNRHDIEAVGAFFTDGAIFETTNPAPDGERFEGRTAIVANLAEMLASTPGAHFTNEEVIDDGGERVTVRWRYDWGDGHVRGVDVMRLEDGKIAESLAYVKG